MNNLNFKALLLCLVYHSLSLSGVYFTVMEMHKNKVKQNTIYNTVYKLYNNERGEETLRNILFFYFISL